MTRSSLAALLVSFALLVPAAAMAATGSKSDPRGDGPRHGDVLRVEATYKARGVIKARLALSSYTEAAAKKTVVGAFFAKRRGNRCDTRTGGAALSLETWSKRAEAGQAPERGRHPVPAKLRLRGNTVTMSASGGWLARKGFDCVVVASLEPTGPTTSKLLDRVDIRLRG